MGLFSHCKDVYKQKDYWKSDVCCHHSHLDGASIVVGNGRQVTHVCLRLPKGGRAQWRGRGT